METRIVTAADIAGLCALHAQSFGQACWHERQLKGSIENQQNHGWLIEESHMLCAFILVQVVGEEAEILTFCVTPEKQKQGIGHKLLEHMLEEGRRLKVKHIFLEVAEDNAAAISLYTKNGFILKGKRTGYYRRAGQVRDALLFRRAL